MLRRAAREDRRSERADRGGWINLFRAKEGVAEEEENAEDPDEGADFAVAAGAELDEGEGEEAEAEARGNAEGEGGGDQGEEGGEGFAEIVPADAGDGAAHERANENEGRSGGVRRNRGDQRGAKHGEKKERGDHDVAQTSARAGGDSGGAFDIAGDGGRSGERAEHGAESVGEQRAARARKFSFAQEAAFFADADQSAHVIKEVDEEKHEDEFAKAKFC